MAQIHATALVELGLSIDTVDHQGETLLLKACRSNDMDTVKYLIDHGADVNKSNTYDDDTLLHAACKKDNYDIIKYLVEHNADINALSGVDRTPLHVAIIENARLCTIQYLVENGANIDAVNCFGNTPLHNATYFDNIPVIEYLLSKGAKYDIKNKRGEIAANVAEERKRHDIAALIRSYHDDMTKGVQCG